MGLAFATAAVTLMSQVLVHRMVSAKLLNNFAFFVLSLTMLGFAASGVLLTRYSDWPGRRLSEVCLVASALFGPTIWLATWAFYRTPNVENWAQSPAGFAASFLACLPMALVYAAPFALCGLVLGALLASPALDTHRIYAADLLGSACGAAAVAPAITLLGVERALGLAAIGLVAAAAVAATEAGRRSRALALGSLLFLVPGTILAPRVLVMTYPEQSYLGLTQKADSGFTLERIVWDPVARIEVLRTPPPDPDTFPWPALVGRNRRFLQQFDRMFTQNNNAFTYALDFDGHRESLAGIDETIYAAAYEASSVPNPRVLVIGVGGGFDILTALYYEASSVIGVEINGATLDLVQDTYRSSFRGWVDDPRVRLVHSEGRHHLARDPSRYDVLQLSGVDTVSGSPASAHVFSENYLYCAEAFDLYLDRLSPDGMLNMMRNEFTPPRDMIRALVSATEALRRKGLTRPRDHVAVLASHNGSFTALLLKRSAFRPEEVARLGEWTEGTPDIFVAAAPGVTSPDNLYQRFLTLEDPRKERAFARAYPLDIRPVDDDRPFFFRFSYWWHLWAGRQALLGSLPVMEIGLLVLLAVTGLAALVCVVLPLRLLTKRGDTVDHRVRYGLYFAGLGLGYMAVEVALLQRFGVFLGHPNHALSVVLAGLLLASGFGARFLAPLVHRPHAVRLLAYSLSVVVLVEHLVVLPLLPRLVAWPMAARVAVVAACLLPLGLCMGAFFPAGLQRLKDEAPAFGPWAWGLNGVFSVVAPVLSVGISMTWGISALLLGSLLVYLGAALVYPPSSVSRA
jgi:MFS family permease